MVRVPSHYDNLTVARNAPQEVIRAAYRVLAQRYHPDRNPSDAEAARIMSAVNEAYRVLSDPELRQQHDNWLALAESKPQHHQNTPPPSSAPQHKPKPPPEPTATNPAQPKGEIIDLEKVYERFTRFWFGAPR